jgi:hypothetical protein
LCVTNTSWRDCLAARIVLTIVSQMNRLSSGL